jgi:large subunit ribosomal protein L4
MVRVLHNLAAVEGKTLILLPERDAFVELSVRNLPTARTLRAHYLNIKDLMSADYLVMSLGALEVVESILGQAS